MNKIYSVGIVFAALLCGCSRQTPADESAAKQIQQEQQAMTALVLKFNPVTNWETSLPDRGPLTPPYSVDVSRALIQSDGRPVLFELNLEDVAESRGVCHVRLTHDYPNFHLFVALRCSAEQEKQFLTASNTSYVVFANISEVSRPSFKLEGSLSGSGDDVESSIELDNPPDVVVAKGELLDAVQQP